MLEFCFCAKITHHQSLASLSNFQRSSAGTLERQWRDRRVEQRTRTRQPLCERISFKACMTDSRHSTLIATATSTIWSHLILSKNMRRVRTLRSRPKSVTFFRFRQMKVKKCKNIFINGDLDFSNHGNDHFVVEYSISFHFGRCCWPDSEKHAKIRYPRDSA